MRVPAGLPLEDGRLACTTCHQDSAGGHSLARQQRSPLLRVEAERLCGQCHQATAGDRRAQHALALGRAHLGFGDPSSDLSSRLCLSCHDGLVSTGVDTGDHGLGRRPSFGGPHPVDMPYNPSAGQSGVRRLLPVSMLDSRLRLSKGKVGCTTCHSPYSTSRGLLVMPNEGSRLCLSCHSS